jgi:hypothetical protein
LFFRRRSIGGGFPVNLAEAQRRRAPAKENLARLVTPIPHRFKQAYFCDLTRRWWRARLPKRAQAIAAMDRTIR